MIPDTSTPSQIPDVLNTKTGILNRLWEKLLNIYLRNNLFVIYFVIFLLIGLPPYLIRSDQKYLLYGDISTFIWSTVGCITSFYVAWHLRGVSRRLAMAWIILAFSGLFYSLGNALWLVLTQILKADPFPSIADFFFLSSYPMLLLGILLIPYKKRSYIERLKIHLETITVVISMGLFLWFFIFKPIINQNQLEHPMQLGVTLAYFSVDTLLFIAIWVLITHKSNYLNFIGRHHLVIGILLLISADTILLVQNIQGLYFEAAKLTDLLYNLSSIFIAMAGLQQLTMKFAGTKTNKKNKMPWLSSIHRWFANFLLLASFYLFVVGHEGNALISFSAVSFWVGCLILISIILQWLDGREIVLLNENLINFNADLEKRVLQRTSELTIANENLAKAMRAKDEFMAAMSHELRTPLTGIIGGAEALKLSTYGGLNEKQNRAVDVIEKSGHRLLSLINDLLDYSRLQSGMFKLLVERYALSEICKATLTAVEPDFKQKNQKVSLQIDPQMIELHTDVVAAKKMLIHLLRNAIKFTPAGGEFGITVIGKKDEQMVEITVWDKGIGIKESDISEIFTPFVQLDAILARQYEGTGIGLAIVHRLVELFNGKIHVLSTPGEGSSFIICLPWQPPVE